MADIATEPSGMGLDDIQLDTSGQTATAIAPRTSTPPANENVITDERWHSFKTEVLARLDIRAEFERWAVEFTSDQPSESGWLSCWARDRAHGNAPSAAVNVGHGEWRGQYVDRGGTGESLGMWEFAAKYGGYSDWRAARQALAEKAGVPLPGAIVNRAADKIEILPGSFVSCKPLLEKYPGTTEEAMKLCGKQIAKYPKGSRQPRYCVALPSYESSVYTPVGYTLMAVDGGMIELYRGPDKPAEPKKRINIGVSGILGEHGWQLLLTHPSSIKLVWKVEGVSDLLALQALIPEDLRSTHIVITNAGGCGQRGLPGKIAHRFTGVPVAIIHDADVPGQSGVSLWTDPLFGVAASVKNVPLPYPVTENHGKDLRDWINEGHTYADLLAMYEAAALITEKSVKPENLLDEVPTVRILEPGTRVLCGDRGNIGTVVSDSGGDDVEIHFVSRDGNEEQKPIPRKDLKFTDGRSVIPSKFKLNIRKAGELIAQCPTLRRPRIEGLLRDGEVANIISAPKFGKSWLVLCLALCIACGLKWLGRFQTTRGKVLLIDNELHPETLAHRLPWVASAMELKPEDYSENLSVVNLRGALMDLPALAEQLMKLEAGAFDLIILDAWYRLQPAGSDENSNGDVTALYNLLDSISHKIGCAFVCVHHSSKGNQGGKAVTDVGSGAGAQARAPDTHLILRQHEHDNAVVVDAAVRSWKPLDPFCMRWEFPIWTVDEFLNPADIRKDKPRRESTSGTADKSDYDDIRQEREQADRAKLLEACRKYPSGETKSKLRDETKFNSSKFDRVSKELIELGQLEKVQATKERNSVSVYITTEGSQVSRVGQKTPYDQPDRGGRSVTRPLQGGEVTGPPTDHPAGAGELTDRLTDPAAIWSDLSDGDYQ